jgi:hypothetical protein
MNRNSHRRWLFAAGVTLLTIAGCRGPAGKVTEAEGTVKIDGKPAVNVIVQFIPDPSLSPAPGSTGMTDASGHYTMITADGRKGAVIGKHMVVVQNDRADERTGKTVVGPLVPEKYTQPGTETVEVKADRKSYDFDLKSN